jgi:tRNA-specific 2-thiouridylase
MSGGVDSSVAAALCQQAGHEVTGMMLRAWSEPGCEQANRCCSPEAMTLARRAAAVLDIPFYVVDAQAIFHDTVVRHFLVEYTAGRTPNPCLVCNRLVRWEFLLEHALEMGAELLATGHYVRLGMDDGGRRTLLRGTDHGKDQSYVLHRLTQDQLRRSLFPLGELTKPQVRVLAEKFNLPAAGRADSQDLCFLAGGDYRAFIRRHAPQAAQPGLITDRQGQVLGRHTGLVDYTIGQRKGLGLPSGVPLYVLAKDAAANTLIVGVAEELGAGTCTVNDLHWIAGKPPADSFRVRVKTRYTAQTAAAEVTLAEGGATAELCFEGRVRAVTPGQAAVFYVGEVVLGGGTIIG